MSSSVLDKIGSFVSRLLDEQPDYQAPKDNSTNQTSLDIAYEFLSLAKFEHDADQSCQFFLTHLKLQKMVYFAQIVSLMVENKPIHNDMTYAWEYGPFAYNLFNQIKEFGSREFTLDNVKMAEAFKRVKLLDDNSRKIVKAIWNNLKHADPDRMTELFWKRDSAWKVTRMNNPGGLITHSLMIKQRC